MQVSRLVLLSAAAAALASAVTPTFSKDVAPILFKNCSGCHRPGEIGPMPLLNYAQVRPWAKSIRTAVAVGTMPPWHAKADRGMFSNDRRLTAQERETILAWVDAGASQGDPKDLPAAPVFSDGWEIGKPDAVLTMTKPYSVPASGTIEYQYIQIPTNFTEDKWIQAIEVRPGARTVVHHVLAFASDPAANRVKKPFTMVIPEITPELRKKLAAASEDKKDRPRRDPGTLVATYAPGTNAQVFDVGEGMLIKAGAVLTLQLHYTANGKATDDASSVGMIFAKQPVVNEVKSDAFMNPLLKLPAGAQDTAVEAGIRFDEDVHISAIFPHTHVRGKGWEYRLTYPDGRTKVVLAVPRYDFNWQTYYTFAKPLAVPKGSRLESTAHYDNSPNNPANPDATKEVHWGDQTWQEMMIGWIDFAYDRKEEARANTKN